MKFFQKAENLCALCLIIFFFMPWAKLWMFQGSGYDIAVNIGSYANLVWLIPIFSIITIIIGFTGNDTKIIGLITGVLPIIGLVYGVIKVGNDIFSILAIGAYLTIIAAIAMILSALGIIKIPEPIQKDNP